MKELGKAINSQPGLQEALQAQLVQSAGDILGSFVFWDESKQRFVPKSDQPDLLLLPSPYASIASAGIFRLAEAADVPIPGALQISISEPDIYLVYEKEHLKYEDMLRTSPDEFARLKQAEIERVGEEKSLLTWIEGVTRELEPDDSFSFGYVNLVDPMTATVDEMVGGFNRHIFAQLRDDAPPNPLQESAQAIRNHQRVQEAQHDPKKGGKAYVRVISDARGDAEVKVLIPRILDMQQGSSGGFVYRFSESKFIFANIFLWHDVLRKASDTGLLKTTIEETVMAHQEQILTGLKSKK